MVSQPARRRGDDRRPPPRQRPGRKLRRDSCAGKYRGNGRRLSLQRAAGRRDVKSCRHGRTAVEHERRARSNAVARGERLAGRRSQRIRPWRPGSGQDSGSVDVRFKPPAVKSIGISRQSAIRPLLAAAIQRRPIRLLIWTSGRQRVMSTKGRRFLAGPIRSADSHQRALARGRRCCCRERRERGTAAGHETPLDQQPRLPVDLRHAGLGTPAATAEWSFGALATAARRGKASAPMPRGKPHAGDRAGRRHLRLLR